jgi:hypothetical protein
VEMAEGMLDQALEAHAPYLPRFAGTISGPVLSH